MTQKEIEQLWTMSISSDEKIRNLCKSILINKLKLKETSQLIINSSYISIEDAEVNDILLAELINNKENYNFEKLNLRIHEDEYNTYLLKKPVYLVAGEKIKIPYYIVEPQLIF